MFAIKNDEHEKWADQFMKPTIKEQNVLRHLLFQWQTTASLLQSAEKNTYVQKREPTPHNVNGFDKHLVKNAHLWLNDFAPIFNKMAQNKKSNRCWKIVSCEKKI